MVAYVMRCLTCQRYKVERVKYPGKLQPLDIPQIKWENVSMEFVTILTKLQDYDLVYVAVDMLTKLVHLFLVCKEAIAKDIAHTFMKRVFMYHGLPTSRIIFNQDTKFTSNFRNAIFEATGTKLSFSTA